MIHKSNVRDQDWSERSHGENFQCGRIGLTAPENDSGLGCAVFKVAPGKRAFPRHAHLANDEAIYVLSGVGVLSVGEQEVEMEEGDFVLIPRGAEYPHVFVNQGQEDLLYICISTMNMPDVVHYPDSEKLGVLADKFWLKGGGRNKVGGFYAKKPVGYWDGEE
ncbi:MAG: cupin domain-containing protein [Gammaproteobacteria bacterium]